jgi:hypothetical protein
VREREWDEETGTYLNTQGNNFTIERIMPSPFKISFAADIWTTNTEMKFQLWEQIAVFFNPSFEIQTTDNYIDWTSLSTVTLDNQVWSSRTIPQGVTEDIDILTMNFSAPIWITPPAKVKKLGIITKIISNVFAAGAQGTIQSEYNTVGATEMFENISPDTTITITPGDFDLLVINNTARLVSRNSNNADILSPANSTAWTRLLDLHPGKFRAGLSQLRFTQPAGNEIISYISLNPSDEFSMVLNIDSDTVPGNSIISGRGTVDAVINPETYNPTGATAVTRYLILEDINITAQFNEVGFDGPDAWKNADNSDFQAHANDIIEWDGSAWTVVFNSTAETDIFYITNSYTGTQYKWSDSSWSKSYEGIYEARLWRLIL